MKTIRMLAIGLGIIIVLVALFIIVLRFNDTITSIRRFLNPNDRANVVSSETILSGIQPMGQLTTLSAQYAKANIQVNVSSGILGACGRSLNFVTEATVEAGVNLNDLSIDSILYDAETNKISITLPPAQLTNCRIDFIRLYDQSFTACATDNDAVRLLAQYIATNEFADAAVEDDLLNRAEQQSSLVIGNFVGTLVNTIAAEQGLDESLIVEIAHRTDEERSFDESCMPETPLDWNIDPANNSWKRGN